MAVVRVLTYNVRSLRDDTTVLTRLIRESQPDILVVQEAPRFIRWRAKCAALAHKCGLLYVAGGRTAGGNLLLAHTRMAVEPASVICRRKHHIPWRPARGVVGAVLGIGGTRLGVVGCHLGLVSTERQIDVTGVLDVVGELDAPHKVVAGDLNEPPGEPSWQRLAEAGLADPTQGRPADPTFPASHPTKRIDAILISAGINVLEYGVPGAAQLAPDYARASDHRPVLAVLEITPSS